jgi:putative transposase
MKNRQVSDEQIIAAIIQHETGIRIVDVVRPLGISQRTFYRWKKKYSAPQDRAGELQRLREEHVRLKKQVADLTLDKAVLQDVLAKLIQERS